MGNGRTLVAVFALAIGVPSAAHAQLTPRYVEVGGGVGIADSWLTPHVLGGDVRVTVPVADRGDVEVLGAYGQSPDRSADIVGLYGGQFRLHLGQPWTGPVHPFLTFGAIGILEHSRFRTTLSPPMLGFVGGGVEHRVRPRLLVRAEAQSVVFAVIPVGVRVAAGVSIPIGSPTR